MNKSIIVLLLILAPLFTIQGQVADSVSFHSLPPDKFSAAIEKSNTKVLVDVREFFEYKKSRIPGALNMPSSGNIDKATDTIPKNCDLFLYCTSGFRSKRVAKTLCAKGFENVYSLEGGINGWKKAGMTISRKRIRR
jgi:rhodanese-related sulfurtransferase